MEMRQLIDNPFTALQSALKIRLSHHKQIKVAVFVGQTIYCIISLYLIDQPSLVYIVPIVGRPLRRGVSQIFTKNEGGGGRPI